MVSSGLTNTQIRELKKGSRFISTDQLELTYKAKDVGESLFQIQIPKRIVDKAVDRNRNKRVIKEAMRSLLPECKSSFMGVIKIKKPLTTYKTPQVKEILKILLQKAHLL